MNRHITSAIFFGFAILGFGALIYHIVGAIQPFDATPAWRHAIFIGVSCICIYGILKRPKWFLWFFGVLTIQQLYSHGGHFLRQLNEGKTNLIDLIVIILTPIVFILILVDRKNKQQHN